MDKRLLDQVQRALDAQRETIQRQSKMLDDQEQYIAQMLRKKDQDIAELTASLNKLAQAQTQQAERLPILLEQLQTKISEQTSIQNGWISHRKNFSENMKDLVSESQTLCDTQIQLVKSMKEYQSVIVPQESLSVSTEQLKVKLKDLRKIEIALEESQTKITDSQTAIQQELTELDKLTAKLNKA